MDIKKASNIAILCCGGSLKYLNKIINNKIDYVILINYFWHDGYNNSKSPLWKNKYVFNFLKDKKIILWTREIKGDIKSLIDNLNVVKCYYSKWSNTLLDDYKWLNNYKDPYLIKKLRLTKKKKWKVGNKIFELIPNDLFKDCIEDLCFFVENIRILEKTKNKNEFKMWLSTFGHVIDYSIKYLRADKIYIVGWDLYQGGSLNEQKIGVKNDIIFRGINVNEQWLNCSISCFMKKVMNNPKINFEMLTYINFNDKIPSQYDKNEYHDLNSFKNLKVISF